MTDVKKSVRLPQTPFGMKARLAETEPQTLSWWQTQNIYQKIQDKNKNNQTYALHDGPPYANGHLHMGHALNKILKDVFLKYKAMQGFKTPFTPGWDCHGLPIEWKVEEEYKQKGQDKEEVGATGFRQACRDFAQKWVAVQSEEFQRLGVFADWQQPYLTMTHQNEALITEKLYQFLMKGDLYKSVKPVYWSVVEQTALAEAEVEYKDKKSPSIYVAFKIVDSPVARLKGAEALIWTTTPWTLPANRAIAYHPDVAYVLTEVRLENGQRHSLLMATELVDKVQSALGINVEVIEHFQGQDLAGTKAQHPWYETGYDFEVPLLPGEHVTTDQGTGLVHTAPGHGVEDFQLGKQFGIDVAQPVADDGTYYDHVPMWAGHHVYKVNEAIIEALDKVGALCGRSDIVHSYPHSWRSKAPLIYRTTPQWFVSMEANQLRQKALAAIDQVKWIPTQGRNRIQAMVAGRPDWCVSRQRLWGIPLPLFIHKETQEILKDNKLNQRIVTKIAKEGTDFWFDDDAVRALLEPEYDLADYIKIDDILDVWFESGCSYQFIRENPDISMLVDLYLEGSDQHRGWFQSSLLVGMAADGKAPFKSVLTHGFIVDEQGYKLSKSKGNAVNLADIVKQDGVDILRLWVAGSDYQNDMRLGKQVIKVQQENYRKIRNVLRFMLGNMPEQGCEISVPYQDLPVLEKYALAHLYSVIKTCEKHLEDVNIHGIYRELFQFCVDLSSFYFDVRKDVLYCEGERSTTYQGSVYVLAQIFQAVCTWLAPILSFTAEEAWQVFKPGDSVFLSDLAQPDEQWCDENLSKKVKVLRLLRDQVNWALEQARVTKKIRSSLEAVVEIYVLDMLEGMARDALLDTFTASEWCDFFIVSQVAFVSDPLADLLTQEGQDIAVAVRAHPGQKCQRCWKYGDGYTLVGPEELAVCGRCHDVLVS
ncbi:MAG: isoleucine--tRNA ligase [Alphaproteobacteria bacterium]|nr:MAG: isoleucine--tRNA ligase [Alphaproteobacteria bacterium]